MWLSITVVEYTVVDEVEINVQPVGQFMDLSMEY